jgi:hypothetical protein
MKKKNHERRKRGAGKKQNSKNSVSESSRKKKSSHHSQHSVTTSEERGSRNKSSTWSFFARIFSCTSNTNSQVVETAHSSRHAPELPPVSNFFADIYYFSYSHEMYCNFSIIEIIQGINPRTEIIIS